MGDETRIPRLGRRSEAVYRALADEIATGVLRPWSRLPTEGELCDRFGVGRNTVRRALARLAAERCIETRQGSGSLVLPPRDAARLDIISIMHPRGLDELAVAHSMAARQDCVLAVFSQLQRHWAPEAEAGFLRQVMAQRHRALLAFCTPRAPRNDALLAQLEDSGVRVIHFEHYRDTLPDEGYILPDYEQAGYAGAIALSLAGYQRLVFAGMLTDGPYMGMADRGFRRALEQQLGLPPDRRIYGQTDGPPNCFDFPRFGIDADAEARTVAFLRAMPKPLGIVLMGADRARLLRETCLAAGFRVPGEVGIIAIEGLTDPVHATDIDSVVFDREGILRQAMEAATAAIYAPPRVLAPPRLVRAGSTMRRND